MDDCLKLRKRLSFIDAGHSLQVSKHKLVLCEVSGSRITGFVDDGSPIQPPAEDVELVCYECVHPLDNASVAQVCKGPVSFY
jgi:hypothetical protein